MNGVSFAVSVATLLLLRVAGRPLPVCERAPGLSHAPRTILAAIWQGQRTIWRISFLRRAMPITVTVNFALAPLNFLNVAWVRQVLHLGAFVYGGSVSRSRSAWSPAASWPRPWRAAWRSGTPSSPPARAPA